jgi:serine protease Do
LSDHREFVAKVLGADQATDIAVLKIETHDLPTVRLGNSEQLGVGDYVLAIGAPFGLEETATAGIVSAKARSLPNDASVPFIQTDVAVNPGNSGGPLFDATGAVVGVNSQIYSTSGGYEGVSFAIPINLVERIEEQIVKTGGVVHGRLGVEAQDLDQALAESFSLSSPNGALVSEVLPKSPAASAGLEPGDVILRFDGAMIADAGQLAAQVSMSAPGEQAMLEVSRDGRPMTFAVPIGSATQVAAVERGAHTSSQTHLGLTLRPLTGDEGRQSGIDGGLLVEDAQGAGAAAGIQEGDVVLSVNGKEVKSIAQLRELVSIHGKRVALLIQRGDDRLFVPVATGRGPSD